MLVGPRLVRPAVLAVAIGALAGFSRAAAAPPSHVAVPVVNLRGLDDAVLGQLNDVRRSHGLVALTRSRELDASAAEHSRQMGRVGYFHHSSADGTSFSRRIAAWYSAAGSSKWAVGENLLWRSPAVGAAQAMRMWMASPPHRTNVLRPQWQQVGIAAAHFASAPGVYGGKPVTILTIDFGVR
jgi:uncharacterized protein YkwD